MKKKILISIVILGALFAAENSQTVRAEGGFAHCLTNILPFPTVAFDSWGQRCMCDDPNTGEDIFHGYEVVCDSNANGVYCQEKVCDGAHLCCWKEGES